MWLDGSTVHLPYMQRSASFEVPPRRQGERLRPTMAYVAVMRCDRRACVRRRLRRSRVALMRRRSNRHTTRQSQSTTDLEAVAVEQGATTARHAQRRLTATEVDRLASEYLSGSTLDEMAASFGVHARTAARQLERRGVRTRGQQLSTEVVDEIEALYASGLSLAQVGEPVGVTASTVLNWLRRRGAVLRPRSGYWLHTALVRLQSHIAGLRTYVREREAWPPGSHRSTFEPEGAVR